MCISAWTLFTDPTDVPPNFKIFMFVFKVKKKRLPGLEEGAFYVVYQFNEHIRLPPSG
jgi:hypothetical protein